MKVTGTLTTKKTVDIDISNFQLEKLLWDLYAKKYGYNPSGCHIIKNNELVGWDDSKTIPSLEILKVISDSEAEDFNSIKRIINNLIEKV